MGTMCQQKEYSQIQYGRSQKGNDIQNSFNFDNLTRKNEKDALAFQQSIRKMRQKEQSQNLKFEQSLKKMKKKQQEQNLKFEQSLKKMKKKQQEQNLKFEQNLKRFSDKSKKLSPSQTDMAKVLYAYMRKYGGNPDYDSEIKSFIQQNYNPSYCSYVYLLSSSSPVTTLKSQVIDRLRTAHNNSMISDHQNFIRADETKRIIEYTWTVRNQLTNHRTLYECEASFDEQNRFLKITMRQTDRFNYRPAPPVAEFSSKNQKHSWQKPSQRNYVPAGTDWGAYYNAQTQRSNEQFRANMNKQAQEWNNYAQQKNSRGW